MGFIFILLFSLRAEADGLCRMSQSAGDIRLGFASEFSRALEKNQLEKNSFEFCNRKMAERYLLANEVANSAELENMPTSEIIQLSEKRAIEGRLSAWPAAMIPTKKMKEHAFLTSVLTPEYGIFKSPESISQFRDHLKNLFANPCALPASEGDPGLGGAYSLNSVNEIEAQERVDLVRQAMEVGGSAALCGELVGIDRIVPCSSRLLETASDMRMRGAAGEFTQGDLYAKVIGSGSFDKGLGIAALKLIDRYQSNETKGDVFADLKESFIEAGQTPAQSESMTWDLLGLLSTGGANMLIRLRKLIFPGTSWPAVSAISAIAGILPALDHKYAEQGRLYSLPQGVGGQCDTSKNYHFWLPAYLAHKARQAGDDAYTAMAASYSASKAYHNVGNGSSRGAGSILLNRPFSAASQIVRADLSYAAAGAAYGAGISQQTAALDVDHGIASLMDASTTNSPLTDRGATGISLGNYQLWSSTFSPNSLYQETIKNTVFSESVPAPVPPGPGLAIQCK